MTKIWDSVDIAWMTGLFEGEGHIRFDGRSNRVSCRINLTDKDVLEQMRAVSGIGNINGPYRNGDKGKKPMWSWEVGHGPDVARLLCAMAPLLGERRRARTLEAAERLSRLRVKARITRELVHGTVGGYGKEVRSGIKPCDDCVEAKHAYMRDWHAKKKTEAPEPQPQGAN